MPETIDYKSVIADLKARKEKLEQAISALEGIAEELGDAKVWIGSSPKELERDAFIGLNILQAAEKYLQIVGRPPRTTENITSALNEGGMTVSQGSVSTILRRSDTGDSAVTRVGRSLWGLASWYPNRPRRSKQNNAEEE